MRFKSHKGALVAYRLSQVEMDAAVWPKVDSDFIPSLYFRNTE